MMVELIIFAVILVSLQAVSALVIGKITMGIYTKVDCISA